MAADAPLSAGAAARSAPWRASRLPPGGEPIPAGAILGLVRGAPHGLEAQVSAELGRRLAGWAVTLHASGRAALVRVFRALAEQTGRREVVVPAYTCYSVPAAVVAAGLTVRLVDVDERGRIDAEDLTRLPLERAAAVLVSNLFGVPEPIGHVADAAHAAGCLVVDDAAQALGAADADGPVGARGDAGILSFGRGKPVSALGGGAAVWRGAPADAPAPAAPGRAPWAALARAVVYDVALVGPVFRALAAIPALRIGETEFDPAIQDGRMGEGELALLEHALRRADETTARRAEIAARLGDRIRAETRWLPVLASAGETAAHGRLGLIAPDGAARDAALAALTRLGAGASPLYPGSVADLSALAPHLAAPRSCPGARDLARRVMTLPTHGRLAGRRLDAAMAVLASAG